MRQRTYFTPSHPCGRAFTLVLFAAASLFVAAVPMHAQTDTHTNIPSAPSPAASTTPTSQQNLPSLPDTAPQFDPAGSSSQPAGAPSTDSSSGRRAHAHSNGAGTGAAPFNIPHSLSKTTSSGIKFQLGLPRVNVGTGQRGGMASPLDSGSTRAIGGDGSSLFPSSDGSSMSPSSDGAFGRSVGGLGSGDALGGSPGGLSHAGGGMGGSSAGGLTISAPGKSSMFDVHLSMKDLMGSSFSQGNGGGGGGAAAAGSSAALFGATDTAGDFGGGRGAGGGKGSGARVSMGLRF